MTRKINLRDPKERQRILDSSASIAENVDYLLLSIGLTVLPEKPIIKDGGVSKQ